MIAFLISAIKIIILLGVLITIHELGHFVVAKWCNVKVNEFAIGFGPKIWQKQGRETKYTLRLIPLGGYNQLEGEEGDSEDSRAFSKASIPKRIAIVIAGALVNIIFAIILYFILATMWSMSISNEMADTSFLGHLSKGAIMTKDFILAIIEGLKQLFMGKVGIDQMMGPVGISQVIAKTNGINEFFEMMALISLSLGVTNLLPIPALDGGKIVILLIEAVRRKPLKPQTEINLQLMGFAFLIALSLIVTYKDILRIF